MLAATGAPRLASQKEPRPKRGLSWRPIRHASHLGAYADPRAALECGYNAASIRERIYADVDDGNDQAGFLIYTAAANSDGTLGGLVELGKPENLGRLLRQALDRARICASDPLCSEHDPSKDQSLHGASCHACSFVAETSCERGNRHLDRSLVVPTLESLMPRSSRPPDGGSTRRRHGTRRSPLSSQDRSAS